MRFKGLTGTLLLTASTLVLLDSEVNAERRGGPRYSTFRSGYSHYYRPAVGFYYGNILWPWWGPYDGPWYYQPGYLAEPGYPVIDVRLQVKPENAEVYVDGLYAGRVDDFDGFFQRLHLPEGDHEIQLYLDGYRTVRKTLSLSPGTSYKIEYAMEPLTSGETAEPRPSAPERPEKLPATAPARDERPSEGLSAPSRFGVLVVRVQPASAEILIDGEPWSAAEASAEVVIHLAEGRHRVEVRKEGYQSFETSVDLTAEKTSRLNIRLPRLAR